MTVPHSKAFDKFLPVTVISPVPERGAELVVIFVPELSKAPVPVTVTGGDLASFAPATTMVAVADKGAASEGIESTFSPVTVIIPVQEREAVELAVFNPAHVIVPVAETGADEEETFIPADVIAPVAARGAALLEILLPTAVIVPVADNGAASEGMLPPLSSGINPADI